MKLHLQRRYKTGTGDNATKEEAGGARYLVVAGPASCLCHLKKAMCLLGINGIAAGFLAAGSLAVWRDVSRSCLSQTSAVVSSFLFFFNSGTSSSLAPV